jgi:hypothetical protein
VLRCGCGGYKIWEFYRGQIVKEHENEKVDYIFGGGGICGRGMQV